MDRAGIRADDTGIWLATGVHSRRPRGGHLPLSRRCDQRTQERRGGLLVGHCASSQQTVTGEAPIASTLSRCTAYPRKSYRRTDGITCSPRIDRRYPLPMYTYSWTATVQEFGGRPLGRAMRRNSPPSGVGPATGVSTSCWYAIRGIRSAHSRRRDHPGGGQHCPRE